MSFLDDIDLDEPIIQVGAVDLHARIAELEAQLAGKKPKNARHSKENPNWQTPELELASARIALGGRIGFDPWSCVSGNARVGADEWRGPDHPDPSKRDGFAEWPAFDTGFANHPGGTTTKAWAHVGAMAKLSKFGALIWEGFSVEQVCVLGPEDNGSIPPYRERWAAGVFYPTDFSIAFLRKRVHYIDPDKPDRLSRPGHANFAIGIGTDPALFELGYGARGQIIHGIYTRLRFPNHKYL